METERVVGRDITHGTMVSLAKTFPEQLTLWQTYLPGDPHIDDYSNTVELYDAVPKFFSSKNKMAQMRINGTFLYELERPFVHKGKRYTVTIKPARVQEQDGSFREYYPSWREELIEEALKKMACDAVNGVFLNETAGVQFTLYALRKELQRHGHGINFYDLLKSLHICHDARLSIASVDDQEVEINSSLFPVLAIANRSEWEVNPKRTRCYVQFHPLVTDSINTLAYRQFNYALCMTFKRQLARWVFKRLSHNYVQASITTPYRIRMSTIVRDSALVDRKEKRLAMFSPES